MVTDIVFETLSTLTVKFLQLLAICSTYSILYTSLHKHEGPNNWEIGTVRMYPKN